MANNEMNHSLLKKFILCEINNPDEQDFSFMIEGPHGIGKSAIISEVCIDEDGFLIDLRLGQRDLGDILGFPTVEDHKDELSKVIRKRFEHIKPELIRKAFVKDLAELGLMGDDEDVLAKSRDKSKLGKPYKFVAFFADEYNRGTKDVQQAMFELVYDRRMSGHKVNPRCFIFAACNDNMEIYTITEGDPAFRSRFKTIKYTPTVDEWLKWGKQSGELCEEVLHVITTQKNLADPPKKQEIDFLNQPHPNRRSWHHFSLFFERNRKLFSETEMRDCCATFVGGDAAEIFRIVTKKMKTTEAKKEESVTTEAVKATELVDEYIQFSKWDSKRAKAEVSKMNASELSQLEDAVVVKLNSYKYHTKATKERIVEMEELEVLPKEMFQRVWSKINDQYKIKAKLREMKPGYFEQYD
jgi:hypothetical protein